MAPDADGRYRRVSEDASGDDQAKQNRPEVSDGRLRAIDRRPRWFLGAMALNGTATDCRRCSSAVTVAAGSRGRDRNPSGPRRRLLAARSRGQNRPGLCRPVHRRAIEPGRRRPSPEAGRPCSCSSRMEGQGEIDVKRNQALARKLMSMYVVLYLVERCRRRQVAGSREARPVAKM